MGVGGQRHASCRFTPGKDPVLIVQETGWAPGPVWTGAEDLVPTGIRSPDRPARSDWAIPATKVNRYYTVIPLFSFKHSKAWLKWKCSNGWQWHSSKLRGSNDSSQKIKQQLLYSRYWTYVYPWTGNRVDQFVSCFRLYTWRPTFTFWNIAVYPHFTQQWIMDSRSE